MQFRTSTAFIAVSLSLSTACSRETPPAPTSAPLPTAIVTTASAKRTQSSVTQEIVGTVRAKTTASIAPNVMGRVKQLNVTLGSEVQAGTVLVRLHAGEINAKARQSSALLDQAALELKRTKGLREKNVIAQSELDASASRHRVAEAALSEARVMQSYTVLRAPFSGVITAKLANVGDQAMPGRPLLVLEDPTELRLEATVPEALASRLELGQPMTVRVEAIGAVSQAKIVEISPNADPSTRTVLVKFDLKKVPGLRTGLFGRVELRTSERNSIEVPQTAVVQRGQLELAFVAKDGRAGLRLVRTGRQRDDAVEILSGLDVGESVITSQVAVLSDDQPIEVK